jgi:hypothetical protein
MANTKTSNLPILTADQVIPSDLFIIVDKNLPVPITKNITVSDLTSYVENNITSGGTVENYTFQATHSFLPGTVVRMDSGSQLFVPASSNTTTGLEAEIAGIVSEVVDQDNFVLTTDGIVTFPITPFYATGGLAVGSTYFLVDAGALDFIDPTEGTQPAWVSKPYLHALTANTAVITNYRGFFRPGGQEFTALQLFVTQSNSFVFGDAVRKTVSSETSSLGNWTLACADSYDSAEVLGVVSNATPSMFTMALYGRLSGFDNLAVGETYYLTPSASIAFEGTGSSRNLLPFDSADCTQFSKPVFVAVSSTEIVITNQRTSPDKWDAGTRCGGTAENTYSPLCYNSANQPPTENILTLVNKILPNALNNETTSVYWIKPLIVGSLIQPSQIVTWNLFKTESGWVLGD